MDVLVIAVTTREQICICRVCEGTDIGMPNHIFDCVLPELVSKIGEDRSCLQRLVPRTPQPTIATVEGGGGGVEPIGTEVLSDSPDGMRTKSNASIILGIAGIIAVVVGLCGSFSVGD